jgi:Membrane bound FAD containing D-sorbitol dehydrogenase
MFDDFLALSRILTGVQTLDAELGRQYMERLASTPFEPVLRQILECFRELKDEDTRVDQVKREILANDMFRPAVCQIILLWYTSAMRDNLTTPLVMRYGTQEEYFSGLAWRIMGAHVPGLSGGYFGHWRYRPDNDPSETER